MTDKAFFIFLFGQSTCAAHRGPAPTARHDRIEIRSAAAQAGGRDQCARACRWLTEIRIPAKVAVLTNADRREREA